MGQGLRVWDQNGNIIVDTNNRLPRVLGQIYVNWFTEGDVEIDVPDFNQGNSWVFNIVDWSNLFREKDTDKNELKNYVVPKIEGNKVKWNWYPTLDDTGYYYATWIIYGVY